MAGYDVEEKKNLSRTRIGRDEECAIHSVRDYFL
jgi:hypothetical protein